MATTGNVVRDAAFARRLEQACDSNPHCPAMHRGRLTWIAEQLDKRFKEKVSVQTVARWMNGEAKPRQAKNKKLAQLLGVDWVWLYMGVQQVEMPPSKNADAVVDAARCLLELLEAKGFPESHIVVRLREAIEQYRQAA